MAQERTGLIEFEGVDRTIVGPDIQVGEPAPGFVVIANDWSEIQPIQESAGKVRVFAAVLSLETSICDTETRRFNEEATALGDDVEVYVISTDLPFTQSRWCGAAGVERVTTASDMVHTDFGAKYGVLVKDLRFLRRAVFVVDREGTVVYSDYMPVLGQEPDYEAVLAAVREAL
jgi:thiol peroxidase